MSTLLTILQQLVLRYNQYPWPENENQVAVFTEIQGGKGDLMAAAKAIQIILDLSPNIEIDWILSKLDGGFASKLISSERVKTRFLGSQIEQPANFLLLGPCRSSWDAEHLPRVIGRPLNGPIFNFLENGSNIDWPLSSIRKLERNFEVISPILFSPRAFPMGLIPGTGVFLVPTTKPNPEYPNETSALKYLTAIQDLQLRSDIASVYTSETSFNFGYAHYPTTWYNYIRLVAMAELFKEEPRNIIIVLNCHGEFDRLNTEQFYQKMLQLSAVLTGYQSIRIIGDTTYDLPLAPEGRSITVIIRPFFEPSDMRYLQLMAERILATGDNSAVEAWCYGILFPSCELYVYEDVANGGCKWKFLQQQVDLAATISINLSRLIALFGRDQRIMPDRKADLDWSEIKILLADPNLGSDTLRFCQLITTSYSFGPILRGAILRAIYYDSETEMNLFDPSMRENLLAHLYDRAPLGAYNLN